MRRHRHELLPDEDLQPTHPVPHALIEDQAASMRELRALHNEIPLGYQRRDARMTALAISNSVSREDIAIATGLVKSRVDQIIREGWLASGSGKVAELIRREAELHTALAGRHVQQRSSTPSSKPPE
jgi:non-ribosomal peptide synthetase component F